VNGEHKITSSHRERTALIYLRQSSMAQVREHTESTRSQYALAGKAAALGWPRSDIEVIDTDLGISGKWGVAREGFTELVTRVCSGEVGAIFGIEITRLARSNADVARLAEFARITGTLLIDPDGVYDPADVNDRVLLGFKGTMGEMELHVMAQRLHANKRAAAERGELRRRDVIETVEREHRRGWKLDRLAQRAVRKIAEHGSAVRADRREPKQRLGGLAQRFIPGQPGGMHTLTGLAHDRDSHVAYDPLINEEGLRHRSLKLAALQKTLKPPKLFGDDSGDLLVIGWGSTKGAIEEAVERLRREGAKVSALHLQFLQPMASGLKEIMQRFGKVMTVESNWSDDPNDEIIDAENRRYSSLAIMLRSRTLIDIDCWSEVRGRPIKPGVVVDVLRAKLKG